MLMSVMGGFFLQQHVFSFLINDPPCVHFDNSVSFSVCVISWKYIMQSLCCTYDKDATAKLQL